MAKDYNPFDFMNAASFSKKNLIGESDNPELTEKEYNPYIVNRGFTYFEDTILHANEMNQRHELFPGAQFEYYRSVLRKRKRFSKWHSYWHWCKPIDARTSYSASIWVASLYKIIWQLLSAYAHRHAWQP